MISCLIAYVKPVTELVEKKKTARKMLSANKGFQSYRWKGLQSIMFNQCKAEL